MIKAMYRNVNKLDIFTCINNDVYRRFSSFFLISLQIKPQKLLFMIAKPDKKIINNFIFIHFRLTNRKIMKN